MPGIFSDHPSKRTVREKWDTAILKWLHDEWRTKFFYFGLPGPDAIDIKLWRDMIHRVVAFEIEAEKAPNRREFLKRLTRNLYLLRIPFSVYCGYMEEVILDGQDQDGQKFEIDEFVTLFNLDFCNRVSGRIRTWEGKKCLRFESIRKITAFQRDLFRRTGTDRFIMFLTALDSFDVSEMRNFVSNPDWPLETREFIKSMTSKRPLPNSQFAKDTGLLKAYVFSWLRAYLHGQNIQSIFLPVVSYPGRNKSNRMIHFTVICRMGDLESSHVMDPQCAFDFLQMNVVRAGEDSIETDPIPILRQFGNFDG